jgi:hypothetical protein
MKRSLSVSLPQFWKVIVLPARNVGNLEEFMALLGDCRTTYLASGDVGCLLFVFTEWESRIDPHRGTDSSIRRERTVDRRIKSASRQTINDDDVSGWLGAECDGPFDLVGVADIVIGIDNDDLLGTLAACDRGQDRMASLPPRNAASSRRLAKSGSPFRAAPFRRRPFP